MIRESTQMIRQTLGSRDFSTGLRDRERTSSSSRASPTYHSFLLLFSFIFFINFENLIVKFYHYKVAFYFQIIRTRLTWIGPILI